MSPLPPFLSPTLVGNKKRKHKKSFTISRNHNSFRVRFSDYLATKLDYLVQALI